MHRRLTGNQLHVLRHKRRNSRGLVHAITCTRSRYASRVSRLTSIDQPVSTSPPRWLPLGCCTERGKPTMLTKTAKRRRSRTDSGSRSNEPVRAGRVSSRLSNSCTLRFFQESVNRDSVACGWEEPRFSWLLQFFRSLTLSTPEDRLFSGGKLERLWSAKTWDELETSQAEISWSLKVHVAKKWRVLLAVWDPLVLGETRSNLTEFGINYTVWKRRVYLALCNHRCVHSVGAP